ncbi:MAG: putative transrane protein [Rhodospirillales bacterium]|nr:putative transrane protein [Rhodospirillales bacterium]
MRFARLFSALLLAMSFGTATAQSDSLELAVKATYLYKLTPFVEWPDLAFANAASPFLLCLAGKDPFGPLLDQAVEGQRVGQHAIEIRRLVQVERTSGCHVLYAGGTPAQPVDAMLREVRGTPVLTVTDGALPPESRGVVHFVVQGGRVRFELDDQSASYNRLTLSAKLLSLAVAVRARA